MSKAEALDIFKQARFGMFIHWGIYSLLEDGEWVMYRRRIPVAEYEKLADCFNPTAFDAEKWVLTAKSAGMRYIVITAKHHDGFSMFSSKVSPFNIVDATPFKRDPMKELAEACRRHGLKLGFYYSHVREWRHPMAQSLETRKPDTVGNYGNFWDYPDESKKDLQKYIDEFDIPQLRELLTQYGDILTIWFDTESMIKPWQAEQIRDAVHAFQPDCLVNGRISGDIETDYATMGDNEVPACGTSKPWDTPMTTSVHRAWGYKSDDACRPAGDFIRELCDIASKGGNYLLNVGPDARGVIPPGTVRQLAEVGEWLNVNGEAIFGTEPVGLCYRPKWGCVTKKERTLYAIVFDENAASIRLTGLKSKVVSCKLLGGGSVEYEHSGEGDGTVLILKLDGKADNVRVIAVDCGEEITVTPQLMPGDDDSIELNCMNATVCVKSPYSKLHIEKGATHRWLEAEDSVAWSFITTAPGTDYEARLVLKAGGYEDFGHEIACDIDGETRTVLITAETAGEKVKGRRYLNIGPVHFSNEGIHSLTLQPKSIARDNWIGLTLYGIELIKK